MVDPPQETGWEGGFVPGHGAQNDVLRVDRDAIPGLRTAFADALARVDRQLELANNDLRVAAWAKDPVSLDATTVFNDRALDSDAGAALDMLRSYRAQLDAAVRNLHATAEQYRTVDEDNNTGTGNASQG
jgi:hypothetical protein